MAAKKATAKAAKSEAKRPAAKAKKAKAKKAPVVPKDPEPVVEVEPAPLKSAPASQRGMGSSAVVADARRLLAERGPFVPYKDGFWGAPKARLDRDGHPQPHIKAFVLEILVRKEQAEFTKFKPTRGGKRAVEVRAKGGARG